MPPPQPVPRGSQGYGEGARVSMETGGERRKRFWAGAQRGQGPGRGRRDHRECARSPDGIGVLSTVLPPSGMDLSPALSPHHCTWVPITSPTSLLPAPRPCYQLHIPTTSPTSPSPPQTPALLGSTWLGTGLEHNHPIPLGTSQAAPPSPAMGSQPPCPLSPLPRGPGASGDSFSVSPSLQARQASSTRSRPDGPLPSSMPRSHSHRRADLGGKGGFGEGRAGPACLCVCFQDLILFRTSDRHCWSARTKG